MRKIGAFEKTLIASLLAFLACAMVSYIGMVIALIWTDWPAVDWLGAFFFPAVVVVVGAMVGLPSIALFGAPAYALLSRHGRASFATAALVGLAPGVALYGIDRMLGPPAVLVGLLVGLATHWLSRPGPNNSSKPTPLRGAA